MDTVTQVQILNKAVYISHNVNNFGKRLHPNILSLVMGQ